MSEEAVVESKATPEQQAQAEKIGWIPPARFKGDPERFVDADAYIERGETVLPIVKEQNKRLSAEVAELRANQAKTEAALASATKAIEEIEERHSVDTQKAVENARRQVKLQLAAASEAGDHEGVAELTDKLTQLKAAEEAPVVKIAAKPAVFTPPPDLADWNRDNPWFGTNKRKTALALGIAQELKEAGETSVGRVFFDKVAAEVDKELGGRQEPREDKVEGGRGGEGDSRPGTRKGYSALPADARAACDVDAKQFVGPNKKYKTLADWRGRYAELYFETGV